MTVSPIIFAFAPIPLTNELNPLAHAAILTRRRQAENGTHSKPRSRIRAVSSKLSEPALT
ncbi:MAG TPA: hypothetical protein VL981_05920 [Candidatus Methylacidiphilales bacterium]|nr:hypothetical protein [Candidatus Methylacidiphilales bacterium]